MIDTAFVITVVGTGMGIIIALGGIVITLFLWNRNEANADRRDIVNLIIAIKDEMKDFHLRLEKQDLDFKARMVAIEERRK